MPDLFWIDHDRDRTSASDGVSRYGYYVRARFAGAGGFAECWDGTWETRLAERFAAVAWRTATSPVMSPAYADWRPPVLSATLAIDADSGTPGLVATVDIAAPWPRGLADARGHVGGRSWWPWKRGRSYGDDQEYFRAPYEDEVTRGDYYALTTLRLVFPVPVSLLPAVPHLPLRHGEAEKTAREAVAAVAAELNRVTGPVAESLEGR